MGYYSHVSGEIKFDPPAAYTEIQAIKAALGNGQFYGSIGLDVEETQEETPEGVLIRQVSSAVVPAYEDAHKAYTLGEEVEQVVAMLPGRTFEGYIQWEGEETGDLGRYVVRDGHVVEQTARFIFEDE